MSNSDFYINPEITKKSKKTKKIERFVRIISFNCLVDDSLFDIRNGKTDSFVKVIEESCALTRVR